MNKRSFLDEKVVPPYALFSVTQSFCTGEYVLFTGTKRRMLRSVGKNVL